VRLFVALSVGVATPLIAFVRPAAADPAGAPRPGLQWELTSARGDYRVGEPVRLIGTVTNLAAAPCGLTDSAEGTVQILGVRLDGRPVSPRFARGSYPDGLAAAITAGVRPVPANGGLTVLANATTVGDGTQVLAAVEPLPDGDGLAALWPVGAPGRYEVSATYLMPRVIAPEAAGDPQWLPCVGAAMPVTVTFTVGRPALPPGWPSTPVLVAVVALLAGVLVVLAWAARRGPRRGLGRGLDRGSGRGSGPGAGPRAGRGAGPGAGRGLGRGSRAGGGGAAMVAATLAGTLVAALAVGLVDAPRARAAGFAVDPADPGFAGRVAGCLSGFAAPGADPAGILPRLADPASPRVRIAPSDDGETAVFSTALPTGPGSSTVDWDPAGTDPYTDGVPREPCASLYHALADADGLSRGGVPTGICGGIPEAQLLSTRAENRYRANANLPPRTSYAGRPLPGMCRPAPAPTGRVCTGPGRVCARYGGDPHLTTFDQYAYDLQAVGEFVLAGAGPEFRVQARQAPLAGSRSVALTTALAFGVGAHRIVLTLAAGTIRVRLDGVPITTGSVAVPGGGRLTRRAGGVGFGNRGYALWWPDGSAAEIDQIGPWSLRLYLRPAAALAGRVRGLLGDFDGDPANDLTRRDGTGLPHGPAEPPPFGQLYPGFADQWRVRPAESLFDYPPGQSAATGTAAATDRGFPERPAGTDLAPGLRAQAEALCMLAGVAEPWLLAGCAQDVGLSGQPVFAVAAADTQRTAPHPAGTPNTHQLGTLRDGDRVGPDEPFPGAGWLAGAMEQDRYGLALPPGTAFRLFDLVGQQSGVRVDLVGADGRMVPGGGALPGSSAYRIPTAPGRYELRVAAPLAGGLRYGFRLVALKPRQLWLALGHRVRGRLELPGRVDQYAFGSGAIRSVTLSMGGSGCRRVWLALLDGTRLSTPVQPCLPVTLGLTHPGRHTIMVWADDGEPADYAFTVTGH
jgi:hypothetical protein